MAIFSIRETGELPTKACGCPTAVLRWLATSTSQLAGYAGLDPLKHSSTGATSYAIPLWWLGLRGWVHERSRTLGHVSLDRPMIIDES